MSVVYECDDQLVCIESGRSLEASLQSDEKCRKACQNFRNVELTPPLDSPATFQCTSTPLPACVF